MRILLHSCVKMRELIELSFGLVSGADLGIYVLDGIQVPRGRGSFGVFRPETAPLISVAHFRTEM